MCVLPAPVPRYEPAAARQAGPTQPSRPPPHCLTQAPAAAPAPGQHPAVGCQRCRVELGGGHGHHLLVMQALQAGRVLLPVGRPRA